MKVMVFSPHPDDDLIGCGGSIAKHIKNGNDVTIIYMTSGDAGSLKYSKKELAEIREKEAIVATEQLGVTQRVFLRNPDGYLSYNQDNLIQVINLIRQHKPDILYLPHKTDSHKDHMTTAEIVLEAAGRASGPWFQETKGEPWSVKTILCYEVWTPLQDVSYVEDITEFVDVKISALEKHVSQVEDINYHDAVKGLNRYRGVMTGKGKYCECFVAVKVSSI